MNTKGITITGLLFALLSLSVFSQPLHLRVESIVNPTHENVTATFKVEKDFTSILSMQFSIAFDQNNLEFQSIDVIDLPNTKPTQQNFGVDPQQFEGKITFLWLEEDPVGNGVTLPDGTSLFSINFVKTGDDFDPVCIVDSPTLIEIVRSGFIDIPLLKTCELTTVSLYGNVFTDIDQNCLFSNADVNLAGWKVTAKSATTQKTVNTFDNGIYQMNLGPDVYELSVTPPANYWMPCIAPQYITISTPDQYLRTDIPMSVQRECPHLKVSATTPFLRRCFENIYHVNYNNDGTSTAVNSQVEVELDAHLDFISSSIAVASQDGNSYRFLVGDLPPGSSGHFTIKVKVNCNSTVLGQTHCTKAHIFSDNDCEADEWNGAFLATQGNCDGDSITFTIANIGNEDMQQSSFYKVIRNYTIIKTGFVKLNSGAEEKISFQADGATYRIISNQVAQFTGPSEPTTAIEGCGSGPNGQFDLGYVTAFPEDDGLPSVDIDCQENRGSYDPNDKQGFPAGVGSEHLIESNTDLEYLIRFQNTGTDTAFTVKIIDTISSQLDLTTVVPAVASHPYTYEITDGGILIFTFDDILLPDSTTNEPASHGHVRFRIKQQPDLPLETTITNSAAIYFDFNAPIMTNEVRHKISEDFLDVQTSTEDLSQSVNMSVYPNPASAKVIFQINSDNWKNSILRIYHSTGQLVFEQPFDSRKIEVHRPMLSPAVYTYQIITPDKQIQTGRLIMK